MSVFQNFYCRSGQSGKWDNFLIDIYSIVEVGPVGVFPRQVWLSSGNCYFFNEDDYQRLLDAMDREGIEFYDYDGKKIH